MLKPVKFQNIKTKVFLAFIRNSDHFTLNSSYKSTNKKLLKRKDTKKLMNNEKISL